MHSFSREEIRASFDAKLAAKKPIVICETSAGITAKLVSTRGADMLLVTNASGFRLRGVDDMVSLRAYGNANEATKQAVTEMRFVVDAIPVVAGIDANDPFVIIDDFVDTYKRIGVSGVFNYPTLGISEEPDRAYIDKQGYGFLNEIADLKKRKADGLFTIGGAFYYEDAKLMAEADVDAVLLNLRFFVEKGTAPELYNNVDKLCKILQREYCELKAINPNCYVVVHGGPFAKLENVRKLLAETDIDGFVGSSMFDADVMRASITADQQRFASLRLR